MGGQNKHNKSCPAQQHSDSESSLLQAGCNWLEALIRLLGSAVWLKDDKGRWQMANPAAMELFGLDETGWQGKTDDELIAIRPELTSDKHCLLTGDEKAWHHNGVITRYERVESPGEPPRLFEVRKKAFQGGESRCNVLITVASEIEQLDGGVINAKVFVHIVEQSPISVLITDPDGIIVYVNKAFEHISGYSASEALGCTPSLQKSGKMPDSVYRELWHTISGGKTWRDELRNRRKDGSLYWEEVYISPVIDESGSIRYFLALKQDVSLRKQQEMMIAQQANFDNLTGLPNRFLIMDRLNQLLKTARRSEHQVAVLFLDFDDFKKVNDSLGHEAGDRFLVESAKRIKGAVCGGDTVGRLGGDEFLILLGSLEDSVDAAHVARNILQQFNQPVKIDGRELLLTASIGIAVYPGDGHEPGELMRKADSAMYHAKEQGRNTYFYFTNELEHVVVRRLTLEEHIRSALQNNEFTLLFQPQVDVLTGRMVGVETLLRWENPLIGKVSPEEFIPVAESTGMIVPIGKWVLEEALRQMDTLRDKCERSLKLAVNLSPIQFRDPDLLLFIADCIDRHGIGNGELEIEITEGALIDNEKHADWILKRLRELGVTLAIDDFGTGYASLGYLSRYPFDVLKLDRSFVGNLVNNPKSRSLLTGAIALAHGMGMSVVAEGVETREQLDFLARLHCEFAQGYLFGKPVPASDIEEFIMQKNRLLRPSY